MNTLVKGILTTAAFSLCIAAMNPTKAQEQEEKTSWYNVPPAGYSSIGFTFNPISGKRANDMFKAGDFIGNAIAAQGASPAQMVILADPLISVRFKHKMTETTAFRVSLGFSGANFKYREYVRDDEDFMDDALSTAQVEDMIHFSMNGGGVNLGLEFSGGRHNLQFTGGFGLIYSFGGGAMKFTYGNYMDNLNPVPTIMPIIGDTLMGRGTYYDINLAGARPLHRYQVGLIHAFGLSLDVGMEWFFMENLSVGASLSIIPIIFAIQPETYTKYEGYSVKEKDVMTFTKKISSGSRYTLYGTENIGLMLSFNKYF